jgi:hypothetical protein
MNVFDLPLWVVVALWKAWRRPPYVKPLNPKYKLMVIKAYDLLLRGKGSRRARRFLQAELHGCNRLKITTAIPSQKWLIMEQPPKQDHHSPLTLCGSKEKADEELERLRALTNELPLNLQTHYAIKPMFERN